MDRPGWDDQTGWKYLQNVRTAPVSPAGQNWLKNRFIGVVDFNNHWVQAGDGGRQGQVNIWEDGRQQRRSGDQGRVHEELYGRREHDQPPHSSRVRNYQQYFADCLQIISMSTPFVLHIKLFSGYITVGTLKLYIYISIIYYLYDLNLKNFQDVTRLIDVMFNWIWKMYFLSFWKKTISHCLKFIRK